VPDLAQPGARSAGTRGLGRRDFITLIGGAAAAWPLAARAQPPAMPVIGFLSSELPSQMVHLADAFRQGLGETGYVEHRNLGIEYRWAEGRYDRVPALAADLVKRQVAVIVATGGSVVPAKAATTTIPIVFVSGADVVDSGIVASLNRPGGNITGVVIFTAVLVAKRLELLRELVPTAAAIGMLVNPANRNTEGQKRDALEAARALGIQLHIAGASSERDFEPAVARLLQQQAGSLMVSGDPFFNSRREQLVALASRHGLPAIYDLREFAEAGGLMSYGTSRTDAYRLAGVYAGRVLKGDKPGDMPVVQPTKFELVINLKTAKALGLTVPLTLQVAADEVIE
jgi:putative ABC transport system substrate-binding protein